MNDLFGNKYLETKTSKYPVSLLKSAIQKNVRRGRVKEAVKCTKSALESDLHNTLRRLPVIVLEDALLHPEMDFLVHMIKNSSNNDYQLTEKHAQKICEIIAQSAATNKRDEFLFVNQDAQEADNWHTYEEGMDHKEKSLVKSLAYRGSIGGLQFDVRLFKEMANAWAMRFASAKWDIEKVKSFFPEVIDFEYTELGYAQREDIPIEAVDFHCSPLVHILLRKDYVIEKLNEHYPEWGNKDALTKVIWTMRAGVNTKTQIHLEEPVDWMDCKYKEDPCGDEHRHKLEDIMQTVKEEADSIANWFLDKKEEEN
jgi:hypothetical protein